VTSTLKTETFIIVDTKTIWFVVLVVVFVLLFLVAVIGVGVTIIIIITIITWRDVLKKRHQSLVVNEHFL
jgi:hypothetical protein